MSNQSRWQLEMKTKATLVLEVGVLCVRLCLHKGGST